MTVTSSSVFLINVATGEPKPAQLLDAITEAQLADWEGEWLPELFKALQRLHRAGVERARWPQSRQWDWRKKVAVLQGMMFADTTTKRCRIPGQVGKDLVYVSFVENAPWNRKELFNPPRYRGVGTILMRAAIELSKELEFKGRIGLHSLPQANGFYANVCGMTDLGPDAAYQDLRYFEMTPNQAEAFVEKGGKS